MGTNEIIRRRALQSGGSAIDWESIARGMLDYTTIFEVPEGFAYNSTKQYAFFERANLVGSVSIPDASVADYQAASGWSNFASKIKPMSQRPAGGVISLIISYLCGFSAERRAA